jgi:hypothetical protein
MNLRIRIAALIVIAFVVGAATGAWYILEIRSPAFCELSGRPIHLNMATVAELDGKRIHTCCARCALVVSEQLQKPVRIIEVTDFATGKRLRAKDAFFVDGSQVQVCSTPRLEVDASRTPYLRLFDRCGPSLLAFAREDVARDFIAQHGGKLRHLDQLMQEIKPQKP